MSYGGGGGGPFGGSSGMPSFPAGVFGPGGGMVPGGGGEGRPGGFMADARSVHSGGAGSFAGSMGMGLGMATSVGGGSGHGGHGAHSAHGGSHDRSGPGTLMSGQPALSLQELYGLPPEARSILYKTEMCKNYAAMGSCPFAGCVLKCSTGWQSTVVCSRWASAVAALFTPASPPSLPASSYLQQVPVRARRARAAPRAAAPQVEDAQVQELLDARCVDAVTMQCGSSAAQGSQCR